MQMDGHNESEPFMCLLEVDISKKGRLNSSRRPLSIQYRMLNPSWRDAISYPIEVLDFAL